MHKYLLLLLLSAMPLSGGLSKEDKESLHSNLFVVPGGLRVTARAGQAQVLCHAKGMSVIKDRDVHTIEEDCMDSMLRKMDYEQRAQYIMNGGTLILNQATNGQYTLRTSANLKGGGLLGAKIGCWIGKASVYLVVYGGIGIATLVSGGLAGGGLGALAAAWAPAIEVASKAGAIAGGIIGGVLTGPA